jgi:hypothetical protein
MSVPSTRQELLAEMVMQSRDLLKRYLRGFDDSNCVKQAPGLPNHVAWTLGHLAINLHRTAERFDNLPIPAGDFVTRDGRGGDREHFDTESVSFGSKPLNDPALYPTFPRCIAIFDAAIDRMANALRGASDAQLDSLTQWGKMEVPLYTMAGRMVFHNGTHTGQIADLRRALGMGSVLG